MKKLIKEETLDIVRQMITDGQVSQEVAEKYFPELKESKNKEDERLRKTTIAFLEDLAEQGYENAVECIDWLLNKQGEQKQIRQQCADFYNKDSELQMPRLTAFENELADILFEREYDGSTETEDDIQRGRLEYELAAIRLAPKLQSLINIEQKPVEWSDEDEKTIFKMRDFFIRVLGDKPDFTEDKRYEEFIEFIDNRLKSLRGRFTWKPSEEQTVALDGICSYIRNKADWEISQDMISDLYKLSEQLKKLREE